MGSTSQTGWEREMYYLIVLLLISPAFGMPNWPVDIVSDAFLRSLEAQEVSRLDNWFIEEAQAEDLPLTKLDNYEHVRCGSWLEANVLKQYRNKTLLLDSNKSLLQQTRHEVRDLAETTVAEVRDVMILLEDFKGNNDTVLIQLAIDIMKDLMLETQGKLEFLDQTEQ